MDRLSALPDDVLCHILSFLSTKNSVATSVLARRWKFLWTFVPNIDLGLTYGDDDVNLWTDTNLWNGFSKIIINRVMLLHKAPRINTFRLCNNLHDCREYELRAWIRTAISRSVRNIEICFNYNIYLPQCLFTYKTLVDLTLICHVDIPVSFDVYLPALKKLTLGIVRVKIDTPALRYIHAYEPISEDFSARALTSLMEADIVFVNEAPIEGDAIYSRNILEFLGRLCNVKCLKLSTTPMKVPDSAFSALTIRFPNLTKLELPVNWCLDWRLFLYLLGNADNLEVTCWIEPPHQVPTCLLSHLRTVTISLFECAEHEFELISYILGNAKVLKRMEIYFELHGIDLKGKFDGIKKISLFERGSKACELVFH
ncbi:hypothetical protein DH2020_007161 [Rehmannia glutinosa]|uniref:F-box domain-containing protein n=1 Tax=Rehmannia glutinosa TaxID=99300 RepID=A0ABR0TXF0_REHGL